MSFLASLIPRSVIKLSSRYNQDIRLVEFLGVYKIVTNGSQQSGPIMDDYYRETFRAFGIGKHEVKKALALGVAGGSSVQRIRKTFPGASITGVDIDEVMVDLGIRYFGLGDVAGLSIHIRDARKFVEEAVARGKTFDLIVLDIFIGSFIPTFVGKENFLHQIRKIVAPGGMLLVNSLRDKPNQNQSQEIAEILRKSFLKVRQHDMLLNRFFCAYL